MPPADVWLNIEGYTERIKQEWELQRMTWFYIHTHSMVESKHKKKTPQSLHPFGWEKNIAKGQLSPKEILEQYRKNKIDRKLRDGRS